MTTKHPEFTKTTDKILSDVTTVSSHMLHIDIIRLLVSELCALGYVSDLERLSSELVRRRKAEAK